MIISRDIKAAIRRLNIIWNTKIVVCIIRHGARNFILKRFCVKNGNIVGYGWIQLRTMVRPDSII